MPHFRRWHHIIQQSRIICIQHPNAPVHLTIGVASERNRTEIRVTGISWSRAVTPCDTSRAAPFATSCHDLRIRSGQFAKMNENSKRSPVERTHWRLEFAPHLHAARDAQRFSIPIFSERDFSHMALILPLETLPYQRYIEFYFFFL